MDLGPTVRIHDLLSKWPFLQDFLVAYNPRYRLLENRAMRATMGRIATLQMVATMGEVPLERLLADLRAAIAAHTGAAPDLQVGSPGEGGQEELDTLKAMIRRLHAGEDLDTLKVEYEPILSRMDPMKVAEMEQQLIQDGTPPEEIQRLCGVHVDMFKRALDGVEPPVTEPGHPVHTFMAENRVLQTWLDRWDALLAALERGESVSDAEVLATLDELGRVEVHYQRKENQLFPYLERRKFNGPSTVMWGVHDEARAALKTTRNAVAFHDPGVLRKVGQELSRILVQMIYMEERILYPTALGLLEADEWAEIRKGEAEIGYAWVTPAAPWPPVADAPPSAPTPSGLLALGTGRLTLAQVDLLLRHLPVDISFVDPDDRVAYYSDTPHRIFPRSPGVIGRAVQQCHPPKSVHVVEEILRSFKAGERDRARFWIRLQGRVLLIDYYAVRDGAGAYQGCLEVSQDITEIQALEGEQRLLDPA